MAAVGGAGAGDAPNEQHENITIPNANLDGPWAEKAFVSNQPVETNDEENSRFNENRAKTQFRETFYTNLIERPEIAPLVERLGGDLEGFKAQMGAMSYRHYRNPLSSVIIWLSKRGNIMTRDGIEIPRRRDMFNDAELNLFRVAMAEELQKAQAGGRRRRRGKRSTRRRRTARRRRSSQRR